MTSGREPHTCTIDFAAFEVFEVGAFLLTRLAYPDVSTPEPLVDELFNSLCKISLLKRMDADPSWAITPQTVKPYYLLLPDKTVTRALKLAERRWRHRMGAARMARGFLGPMMTGAPAELPPGMTKVNLAQLSELVLHEVGESDPENVAKRVWRLSLPVIHLASAIDQILLTLDAYSGQEADFTELMERQHLIKMA